MKEIGGLDFLTYTSLFYWGRTRYQQTDVGSKITANSLAKICRRVWKMDSWTAQKISKKGEESSEEEDRSGSDSGSDTFATHYLISLGKVKGKTRSKIKDKLVSDMKTPPNQVKIREYEENGLLFAKILYHDEETAKKAYREQDGKIKYDGSIRKMIGPK